MTYTVSVFTVGQAPIQVTTSVIVKPKKANGSSVMIR